MYRSPINVDYITSISETISNISETISDGIKTKVMEKVRAIIDVDEEELVKALQYDRNQYKEGFKDGASEWKRTLKNKCSLCSVFWISVGMLEMATQGKMYLNRCDAEDCIIQKIEEIRAGGVVERELIP